MKHQLERVKDSQEEDHEAPFTKLRPGRLYLLVWRLDYPDDLLGNLLRQRLRGFVLLSISR